MCITLCMCLCMCITLCMCRKLRRQDRGLSANSGKGKWRKCCSSVYSIDSLSKCSPTPPSVKYPSVGDQSTLYYRLSKCSSVFRIEHWVLKMHVAYPRENLSPFASPLPAISKWQPPPLWVATAGSMCSFPLWVFNMRILRLFSSTDETSHWLHW